ncbi:MAG: STAS domain-containing protein [Zoogloea sp.]|uniref:STAS domain-containing protein n=1 Tax=Zoogloea sp. TaxID=49181 RepID=UPI003F3925F8
MQVNVTINDSKAAIRLQGRFDFNTHREFRESSDAVITNRDVKEIVVDLGETEYLDSSALGMLLMLRDKASSAGKRVALANCKGPVRQVLDIANFAKLFEIS